MTSLLTALRSCCGCLQTHEEPQPAPDPTSVVVARVRDQLIEFNQRTRVLNERFGSRPQEPKTFSEEVQLLGAMVGKLAAQQERMNQRIGWTLLPSVRPEAKGSTAPEPSQTDSPDT